MKTRSNAEGKPAEQGRTAGSEPEQPLVSESHPWYGVPAHETDRGNSYPIWSVRKVRQQTADLFTRRPLGTPEQTAAHLAGKSSGERLCEMATDRLNIFFFAAAADPKLPERERKALVTRGVLATEDMLSEALLANPCLTAEEIERIACQRSVCVRDLSWAPAAHMARRVYEHPNCSPQRLAELFLDSEVLQATPAKDQKERDLRRRRKSDEDAKYSTWRAAQTAGNLAAIPHLVEAAMIRSAAMHLSLSPDQIRGLVQRWRSSVSRYETTCTQENTSAAKDLHVGGVAAQGGTNMIRRWGDNVGQAAARLCTHPSVLGEDRTSMLNVIVNLPQRVYDALQVEWSLLGQRPVESDWDVIRGMRGGTVGSVLYTSLKAMEENTPTMLDSHILFKAIEIASWPVEINTPVLQLIQTSPVLIDRLVWTKDLVSKLMRSPEKIVREIAIQGMSRMAHPETHGERRIVRV